MQSVKQHRRNVKINGKISAVIGSDMLDNASRHHEVIVSAVVTMSHLFFCRTITSAPYNRPINVIKDAEFTTANNIFAARCRLYFKAGNPKPKHKPSISEGDMEKLGQYFTQWRSNPDILVEAAWFHLCFYFGRRGREGLASMTKDTFVFEQDAEGHEYVAFAKTETTKNHQGGYKQRDIDYSDQRMYGPGVEILKFLLGKLHADNERLFQHPLVAYKSDGHWFKKEPMGKNTLGNIMQRISGKAGLSMRYTCHCVRASTITTLYRAGIETPSIRSISKHKSTTGLLPYLSDLSNSEKRECSSALTKAFAQQPVGSPVASTSKDTEGWDLHSDIMDVCESDVQSDQYAQGVSVIQASPGGTVTLPVPADDKEALYQVALQPTFQPQEPATMHNVLAMSISNSQHAMRNDASYLFGPGATFNNCTFSFNMKPDSLM